MEDQFQQTGTAAKTELSKLNIKDLFFKYIRFLPLFILSVALALFGAFVYLRYATPIYQSGSSLIIKETKKGGKQLEELLANDDKVVLQNEIELIKSRPIMERVVDKLNLNFSYATKGKVKETDVYKAAPFEVEIFELTDSNATFELDINFINAYGFKINNETRAFSFGQVFKNASGVFRLNKKVGIVSGAYVVRYQPSYTVAGDYAAQLVVAPKGTTNILLLTLQATNAQLAADVLNSLMQEYAIYSVEDKNETIKQELAFINERLDVVDHEVDSITSQLLAYKKSMNLYSFDDQSAELFNQIKASDKQLSQQYAQLELVQMVESYLRNSKNNFSITPSTLGLEDGTLANLIAAYNVAQLERKELIDKNIPTTNPLVASKEDRIERLRQNILESLRVIRGFYGAAISELRKESGIAQSQIKSLPEKHQRLLDIQRQQETKQAVYTILLEQRERSSITQAATTSNVDVIDKASPNPIPVKPNRRSIQLMAVFIGLLLPALTIFIAEVLNDKITSRADIERISDVTILGEVGHSYANEPLVVKPNNRGIVAEQFRILRSNLQYVLNNFPKPVILVTSSFSGEGKSFISTNIGAVMALAGKKTIVLEFDIRKPKVLTHLNLTKKPGLTNYLLGKINVEEVPVAVPGYDNFFVFPCGPVPPNPSELLLDPKFTGLFDYLRANFDVIVMDTAPIGMVSDALTLSAFADATLYIARQGHTYKKQVGLIDEFYRQGKLPKVSVVLNDVKLTSGYGYYGGRYGYGYGYGYGSGYFDDEEMPKPSFLKQWFFWLPSVKRKKK